MLDITYILILDCLKTKTVELESKLGHYIPQPGTLVLIAGYQFIVHTVSAVIRPNAEIEVVTIHVYKAGTFEIEIDGEKY
jgi:hypothetical protein